VQHRPAPQPQRVVVQQQRQVSYYQPEPQNIVIQQPAPVISPGWSAAQPAPHSQMVGQVAPRPQPAASGWQRGASVNTSKVASGNYCDRYC